MLSHFLKCRKKIQKVKPNGWKGKKRKNYAFIKLCGSEQKKSRFMKEKEAGRFLTGLLGIKSTFKRISILGNII